MASCSHFRFVSEWSRGKFPSFSTRIGGFVGMLSGLGVIIGMVPRQHDRELGKFKTGAKSPLVSLKITVRRL